MLVNFTIFDVALHKWARARSFAGGHMEKYGIKPSSSVQEDTFADWGLGNRRVEAGRHSLLHSWVIAEPPGVFSVR